MLIPFLVFFFGLFLVLGAYLFATHASDAKRGRLQKRVAEALLHSAHSEDVEVILARNELMSEIPLLNQLLIRVQAAIQLKRMLDQADLHITPSKLVMLGLLCSWLLEVWLPQQYHSHTFGGPARNVLLNFLNFCRTLWNS